MYGIVKEHVNIDIQWNVKPNELAVYIFQTSVINDWSDERSFQSSWIYILYIGLYYFSLSNYSPLCNRDKWPSTSVISPLLLSLTVPHYTYTMHYVFVLSFADIVERGKKESLSS